MGISTTTIVDVVKSTIVSVLHKGCNVVHTVELSGVYKTCQWSFDGRRVRPVGDGVSVSRVLLRAITCRHDRDNQSAELVDVASLKATPVSQAHPIDPRLKNLRSINWVDQCLST